MDHPLLVHRHPPDTALGVSASVKASQIDSEENH